MVVEARKYWARHLPLPCYRCRRPVTEDMAWHVDHKEDLSMGGDLFDRDNQWPSHKRCNESAGGQLAAKNRRAVTDHEQKVYRWW